MNPKELQPREYVSAGSKGLRGARTPFAVYENRGLHGTGTILGILKGVRAGTDEEKKGGAIRLPPCGGRSGLASLAGCEASKS
jgi:hypothetical protein